MTTEFGSAAVDLGMHVSRQYNMNLTLQAQNAGKMTIGSFKITDHSWAQVALGKANAELDAIKVYTDQLNQGWISFFHEPENDTAQFGSPADYVAAFNHVKQYLGRPTGVSWCVILMGWTYTQGLKSSNILTQWLPTVAYQGIGTDSYNFYKWHNNPWRSFAECVSAAETWSQRLSKPLLVPEFGSYPSADGNSRTTWLQQGVAHAKAAGHVMDSYFDENDSSHGTNWLLSDAEVTAYKAAVAA